MSLGFDFNPKPSIDFDGINAAALSEISSLLSRWLPGGRRDGHEYVVRNPTREDRKPGSFRINLNTGMWADFATDDRGGDPISLAAYLNRLSQAEAAKLVADEVGMSSHSAGVRARAEEQRPSEEPLKPFTDWHLTNRGYTLKAAYDYRDEQGELLYQTLRYEHATAEKEFLARRPDGNGGWFSKTGDRRVLYRAADLRELQPAPVWVCEGEKDADRLAGYGLAAVTVAFAKWTQDCSAPLVGLDCFVLEDNDDAGRKRANKAMEALNHVARSVTLVRLPGLPEKGDVSDWLEMGHTVDDLEAFAASLKPTATGIQALPFEWVDPAQIPPRQWIYGRHYIRKFISCTVAPGGVGKSSLGIVEALAMASGKPLLGVTSGCRFRVWIHNGEDPMEELQRRIMAACLQYGLSREDVEGHLFVTSGRNTPIIVAEQTRDGAVIQKPVVDEVVREIQEKGIDVLSLDPFVSTHRVTENDNNAIQQVAKTWAGIADLTAAAIDLVHHARKTNGAEVGVEDGRGASALLAAARSARALNQMTDDEAAKAGVEQRRLYFRVENGKANLAPPPPDGAEWFHMASVDLGNCNIGPSDQVGVVTSWRWPDPLDNITTADLRAAQTAVAAGGPWRENAQAKDWVGKPIAQALRLDAESKSDQRKISGLLRVWIHNGMFVRVAGRDPKRRDERTFIEVGTWATD